MHRLAVAALAAVATAVLASAPGAQDDSDRNALPPDRPTGVPIVGDPTNPRGHHRIAEPAALSPKEAEAQYRELRETMAEGYRVSRHPATEYQQWRRYTTAPFRSASHGNRYVNVYANAAAQGYGAWESLETLPEGAMIAKDSFTVTADGLVAPGALFVMEKMAPGFNPVGGDWRYTMILPDGSVLGTTRGLDSERVRYCIGCHLAAEDTDHLHLVPEAYRAGE